MRSLSDDRKPLVGHQLLRLIRQRGVARPQVAAEQRRVVTPAFTPRLTLPYTSVPSCGRQSSWTLRPTACPAIVLEAERRAGHRHVRQRLSFVGRVGTRRDEEPVGLHVVVLLLLDQARAQREGQRIGHVEFELAEPAVRRGLDDALTPMSNGAPNRSKMMLLTGALSPLSESVSMLR